MLHRLLAATVLVLLTCSPAFAQVLSDPQTNTADTAGDASVPADPIAAPGAQRMPSWGSLFGDLRHDVRQLPSLENGSWLGAAGALAFGLHQEDASLTHRAVASTGLEATLDAGAFVGGGVIQVGSALGVFTVGRLSGHVKTASIGADMVRAQIIDAVLAQGVKVTVGRRRPDGTRFSFPSGHASSSFATATVLQRRLGWKVGAPAYAMATYVAASRLSENKHYLSDVVFGAAIGIVSGRTVTVGHGSHRFAFIPIAGASGVGIGLTRIRTS